MKTETILVSLEYTQQTQDFESMLVKCWPTV